MLTVARLLALALAHCTAVVVGLHRTEVLEKYSPRLQVGVIEGSDEHDEPGSSLGEISEVPYAEHIAWRG